MIVLDTHVLVWWVANPKKLSRKAREAIEKQAEKEEVLVSSISVWEIYMLVKKERVRLTMDVAAWMEKVESLPYLKFVPVDNWIAAKSVMLPGDFHEDPADRMIIATALASGATLVTGDKRIRNYPHVKSVW